MDTSCAKQVSVLSLSTGGTKAQCGSRVLHIVSSENHRTYTERPSSLQYLVNISPVKSPGTVIFPAEHLIFDICSNVT